MEITGKTMKITEGQARLILNAFSHLHSEGLMASEYKKVCRDILTAFPIFNRHMKIIEIEVEEKGYSYLLESK